MCRNRREINLEDVYLMYVAVALRSCARVPVFVFIYLRLFCPLLVFHQVSTASGHRIIFEYNAESVFENTLSDHVPL